MEQVIGYVATAVIAWVIGRIPKAKAYGKLAGETVDVIYELRKSIKDGNLTEDEIKKITSEAKEIEAAYKLIKK